MEDLFPRIVLFVSMAGSGVLMVWMAYAAASGRLKRNQFIGIRTTRTLESDAAWVAGHARAKRPTLVAAVAAIATGVAAFLPLSAPALAGIVVTGCVLMLGFLFYATAVAGRAAVAVTDS